MRHRGECTVIPVLCTVSLRTPFTALHNADPGSVHIMYSMLLTFAPTLGVSPNQLRQQLEREYELSIDLEADTPLEFPTTEERTRALYYACMNHEARLPPDER
jgi:hypothetical protein